MEPIHQDGVALEEVLANGGPTLSEVYADPVLFQALYRYMVSRFAPESILFRNAVIAYQEAVRSGRIDQARELSNKIFKEFVGAEAPFEIVARKQLEEKGKTDQNMTLDRFDEALTVSDRDLCRALEGFYQTPIFAAILRHRSQLTALGISHAGGSDGGKQRDQTIVAGVRAAYGVNTKVTMRRIFDVGSPYQYVVDANGGQVGWARVQQDTIRFLNMEEMQVYTCLATSLLGVTPTSPRQNAQGAVVEEDGGIFGCCGSPAQQRGSGGSSQPDTSTWFVRRGETEPELGPISFDDMKLFWKYNLIPEGAQVRAKDADWQPIKDCLHFPARVQIRLVDPTALTESLGL